MIDTESEVLAQMYKQLLDKGGVKASVKTVKNRELIEPELEKGKVAVVPEYAAAEPIGVGAVGS